MRPSADSPVPDVYTVVAARRLQWDNLLWQVPVLSLTAQAFLFSISLAPDSSRTARCLSAALSLIMTVLSLHLMVKHRQAEIADSHWLAAYEQQYPSPVAGGAWPMHGPSWAQYRNETDPRVGLLGRLSGFGGFKVWSAGLTVFGIAALAVLLITVAAPSLLTGG